MIYLKSQNALTQCTNLANFAIFKAETFFKNIHFKLKSKKHLTSNRYERKKIFKI